jgi:hypothetical protein
VFTEDISIEKETSENNIVTKCGHGLTFVIPDLTPKSDTDLSAGSFSSKDLDGLAFCEDQSSTNTKILKALESINKRIKKLERNSEQSSAQKASDKQES